MRSDCSGRSGSLASASSSPFASVSFARLTSISARRIRAGISVGRRMISRSTADRAAGKSPSVRRSETNCRFNSALSGSAIRLGHVTSACAAVVMPKHIRMTGSMAGLTRSRKVTFIIVRPSHEQCPSQAQQGRPRQQVSQWSVRDWRGCRLSRWPRDHCQARSWTERRHCV